MAILVCPCDAKGQCQPWTALTSHIVGVVEHWELDALPHSLSPSKMNHCIKPA